METFGTCIYILEYKLGILVHVFGTFMYKNKLAIFQIFSQSNSVLYYLVDIAKPEICEEFKSRFVISEILFIDSS